MFPHRINMNAADKLLILVFMSYSAKAFLDPTQYGTKFTKIATECHDICIDVSGTTEDAIRKMAMGDFPDDDEKVQRYVLCLWRVSKVMDRNLEVNQTLLDSILPKKEIEIGFYKITEKCLVEAKNKGFKENYKTIWILEKCLFKQNPTAFLMP